MARRCRAVATKRPNPPRFRPGIPSKSPAKICPASCPESRTILAHMQLGLNTPSAPPPVPAWGELSENSCQGFTSENSAKNPSLKVCNFKVTTGLWAILVQNSVRETYSARYYNPLTGRFVSMDPENGIITDPRTLHKYLYAGGDPVNGFDPTGRATAGTATAGGDVGEYVGLITALFALQAAAKTVAQNPTSVVTAVHQLGEGVNCSLELDACLLTSLADKWGSVFGESRCVSCYKQCLASGQWPGSIPTTTGRMSCKYWK